MVELLRVLTILIVFTSPEKAGGEVLWCYQCNTDLREGHKGECNDPYNPGPSYDLASCPQNESHHCLKSVVLYRHILVTVRACVPSREIDGYCQHEEYFPQSSIECYFCKDYACNGQGSFNPYSKQSLAYLTAILIFASTKLTCNF